MSHNCPCLARFSPRYMYAGRVYPKYLSGTGYVFSLDAARALYEAALHTPYFHLEDIFITGMCAARASPRIWPKDAPGFSYLSRLSSACALYAQVTAHNPLPAAITNLLRIRDGTPTALAMLDIAMLWFSWMRRINGPARPVRNHSHRIQTGVTASAVVFQRVRTCAADAAAEGPDEVEDANEEINAEKAHFAVVYLSSS
ncbi:Beta-1,3-galactosyltransferase 1 [Eumeta japonica]|uniref:Hexosyltransferase n=1 Tax=Eumeta variegata TaxID=151549 RepID=A0A4C1ZRB0_EUMVA|nr:Beta-1,3-galactosyltransferase 1 [Eumeta japonica]